MAAGNTYVALATQTVSTAVSSISFTSIAGTYTDLVLVTNVTETGGGGNVGIRFNNDSATNYSATNITGNGSGAGSNRFTSENEIKTYYYGTPVTSSPSPNIIHIMNYANSTTYKTTLNRSGEASGGLSAVVGLWRSTAAITRVDLVVLSGQTFSSGSTFQLFGIAAA